MCTGARQRQRAAPSPSSDPAPQCAINSSKICPGRADAVVLSPHRCLRQNHRGFFFNWPRAISGLRQIYKNTGWLAYSPPIHSSPALRVLQNDRQSPQLPVALQRFQRRHYTIATPPHSRCAAQFVRLAVGNSPQTSPGSARKPSNRFSGTSALRA